ncbi:MAG: hypothetical protein IPO17_08595 [Flavobacteriales bacterium]|nr:hypothetical protein [Flavobacteriales bacterium]
MEVKKIDVADLTYEQFYNEHWLPGIPLVLKNASKVWKANGTFSPDWFRANFGDRQDNRERHRVHHEGSAGPGGRQGHEPPRSVPLQV